MRTACRRFNGGANAVSPLHPAQVPSYLAAVMYLALALLLDRMLGDPPWLWSRIPHPAAAVGGLIGWADRRFNDERLSAGARRRRGLVLIAVLILAAVVAGRVLHGALAALAPGFVLEIVLVAILLAHRSLTDHVEAVAAALEETPPDRPPAVARDALSRIVGRDVSQFDTPAIARAAIESLAENFSDGVVAPALWYALFGLPGILAYKAINTADSMIGHRNERHAAFGFGAARADDIASFVPARISAHLLRIAARMVRRQRIDPERMRADAATHASPNAGWPEAAMAHGLGIALGGPRSYAGRAVDGAWLNEAGARDPDAGTIRSAIALANAAWILLLGVALALAPVTALVRALF